ncbi:MAG: class I SAM-dependent methyltransferase [Oscillospiraceae bacterium]|nr:class I SAM-dependent methyltransferase [Oscillospiraceae bacterium]
MSELGQNSVERTLCIPLWSRAIAVRKLPTILPDYDSVRILEEMGETKPPTIFYNMECAALAGAIRQYDLSCEIEEYVNHHPEATIVELGAGLSCLRRQMGNEKNPWINVDFPDVIACREEYIPAGEFEKNVISDITDHRWFDEIPFASEKGAIFLAAGVLHYLSYNDVCKLIDAMGRTFPGAWFVFDYVSEKGKESGNAQIKMTDNATKISFSMENAEKEIPAMSEAVSKVVQKSYLEGYPVKGIKYNWITRMYIRSKREKYFVVRVEYAY